ncbi:hypothetical protein BH11MYX3_BH11MYX3_10310 [soil metagenome]
MLLVGVALVASVIRWSLQGSSNVYTALAKRFYVPDPDLGWRISTQHPIWLGLDACAVLLALGLVLAGGGLVIRRREKPGPSPARRLRAAAWTLGSLSLGVPVAAFVSGAGPLHARDTLPASAAVLVEDGVDGALDAPDGEYVVTSHAGTAVTAHLSAGGEAFDARFGEISGSWRGSPHDLRNPMHAEIRVASASVDTGIGERSKHAREGYLHAETFPLITVTLDRVGAVRANGPAELAFRAPGVVSLMGKTHDVEVTGTFTKLDGAARARLGLTGDVLLVKADFALPIRETALAPNAGDFDGERIPVHVSLVLRHTGV